jgi:hypothetical protein
MDDRRLDELLDDAAKSYRVPPEPALDAIWERVAVAAFAPRMSLWRRTDWRLVGLAAAASLVIGVAAGRWTTTAGAFAGPAAATVGARLTPAPPPADPYERTAEEVLGRTAVLLTAFRSEAREGTVGERFNEQAANLLTTVRLLIDSPVGNDPQLRNLLQDLELVLAQVARVQPSRNRSDLNLITDALEEHDLMPRIRSAVVDLSASGY